MCERGESRLGLSELANECYCWSDVYLLWSCKLVQKFAFTNMDLLFSNFDITVTYNFFFEDCYNWRQIEGPTFKSYSAPKGCCAGFEECLLERAWQTGWQFTVCKPIAESGKLSEWVCHLLFPKSTVTSQLNCGKCHYTPQGRACDSICVILPLSLILSQPKAAGQICITRCEPPAAIY